MSKVNWLRHRFYANLEDYRPVKWPPPGPYWCSGESDTHSVVVAYLPVGVKVTDYWPEAERDEFTEETKLTFSDRFPQPDWWPISADAGGKEAGV